MKDTNYKKHYYKFGLSRKKYYIIRRIGGSEGLFSIVNTHLGHIAYAINHGYIPVVDMQNYKNNYLPDELLEKENSWDYFFEQPLNADLEEAFNGKCIIMGDGAPISPRPDDDMDFFNNVNGELDKWRELAHKYIRVKKDILKDIDDEFSQLTTPSDRVLGVLVRGTDYVATKPFEHPVQPEVDDVISKCKEVMSEYKCNKIFVGTEDIIIANKFQEEFGNQYITNNREFVDYKEGKVIAECIGNRENDHYLKGKEYLTTIMMLTKCNCFVGGRTSGTVGMMMLADGFECSYVYDLGRYGKE